MIKTFGSTNNPRIMLLHGGGLSWWSWQPVIDLLQDDFHVIVPILNGHGENFNTPFTSIEDQATTLVHLINSQYDGQVACIAGLSIGAQVLCDMLAQSQNICKHAIIESALVIPIPGVNMFTTPVFKAFYGLTQYDWFAKLQAKSLLVPPRMLPHYIEDSKKMTKDSLINMTLSNGNYSIKPTLKSCTLPIDILVGDKEIPIMKKSANQLSQALENSRLTILAGFKHGEYSMLHPSDFVKLIINN